MILGFDTSGPWLSAALVAEGALRAEREEAMARGQAEALFPFLEALLAAEGAGWRDLTALAVGTGPGNFTGLRIAVASARGLALPLGVPVFGVTGFDAMTALPGEADAPALVSLPAPRGMAYLCAPGASPVAADPADPRLPALPDGTRAVGHRADEIGAALGLPAEPREPGRMGARAALAAARRLAAGEAPDRPRPLYVRPPDAAPPRDGAPRIVP